MGDPSTKLRRLAGGRAEGGAGDSQKNEPKPGEPENDEAPEKAGEAVTADGRRDVGRGESTSISEPEARGDKTFGSVWDQPISSVVCSPYVSKEQVESRVWARLMFPR